MSGDRVGEGGVNDLWDRLREYRDHAKDLQGEMLADRRVGEERHRQNTQATAEIKGEISVLHGLVMQQGATLTEINSGQRSILQTMESDRSTRIETAAALEAAEKARRDKADGPWVTPNRVIGLALGVAALLAYFGSQLSG